MIIVELLSVKVALLQQKEAHLIAGFHSASSENCITHCVLII